MRHLLKMLFLLVLVGVLFGCSGPPTDPPASEPNESVEQETSSPEGSSTDNSGADVEPSETAGAMGSSSGETQQLAAAVIAPEGGTIIVEHPGDVLDGLAIDVPQDAYQDDAEFSVSSRPFTGALPEGVSVLTPVIEVKNGGEYAADVITVTVPIELPDDHFAMGFFLHEDGSLEGMPLVELQSGSITVATMHFSEFLIAAIANSVLEESVDTGYRPGQDDWQFPNYGSAISPEGNCAGMSISAMWYYTERHLKGAPRLHGLYDNSSGNEKTPDIWLDDSLGYRLASSVQADMDWVGNKIQPLFRTLGSVSDEITWKCFLFSIEATTASASLVTAKILTLLHLSAIIAANTVCHGVFSTTMS